MKRYTEDQKVSAVRIVERFGGYTDDAKAALRALLDEVPSGSTLHGWRSRFGAKPESESKSESVKKTEPRPLLITPAQRVMIEQSTEEALDMMLERAARMFVQKSTTAEAMEGMNSREFMTAAGISIDKMRVIRGLPTEIVMQITTLIDVCAKRNVSPVELLRSLAEEVAHADAD